MTCLVNVGASGVKSSGAALIAVGIIAGIGIGTVWTNSDALVSTLVDEGKLGASMGAAQSFKEFGDMAGPLLIGLLTQVYGVRAGFITCGSLAIVFMLLLALSRTLNPILEARG